MDWFILILFLFEVYILVTLDRQRWGTLLTPFCVLSLTYTFVALIAIFYSHLMSDVKDFYLPSLTVWGVGLIFFYLPSTLFVKPHNTQRNIVKFSNNDDRYNTMFYITLFFVLIGLYKVRTMSGQGSFGSDEFSGDLGATGLIAHITMFLTGAFAYFACKIDRQHKLAILPIILIMIIMFAQSSKTKTLTPLLTGAFAIILSGKIKFSWKTLIVIVFSAISFFVIAYYLSLVATGHMTEMNAFWNFIFVHFLDYFIGGPLSFSLDYEMGILEDENILGLFKPITLIINKIVGTNITDSLENDVFIYMGSIGSTNVRTFFGTLYAYTHSIVLTMFITIPLSTYIYFFYYLAKKNNNIYLTIISALNLTYLVFGGFFDFYWGHIYPFEIALIFFILYVYSKSTLSKAQNIKKQTC